MYAFYSLEKFLFFHLPDRRKKAINKILACSFFFLLFPISSFSQNIQWQKTYGTTGNDDAYAVIKTTDGGYLLVGQTKQVSSTYDIYLVKTDSYGDSLWTRVIDLGSHEYGGKDVKQTIDGGYIITGQFADTITGQYSIGLLKTDGNGNPQWVKRFGGTVCCNSGSGVCALSDGGYAVVGTLGGPPGYPTGNDIMLIRTDSNGNMLWSKKYGGTKADFPFYHAISTTTDEGFIIAGKTESFSSSIYEDAYLIRTDKNGDTLWTKVFGTDTLHERIYSVYQTNDGGFIATGEQGKYPSVMENMYTVKMDSAGDTAWIKTYGGPAGEYSYDAIECIGGGYAITGWTDSYGVNRDAMVIRTDLNGDTIWKTLIGGASLDGLLSIKQNPNGSYILGGSTLSYGMGNSDMYLVLIGDTLTSVPYMNNTFISVKLFPNPVHERTSLWIEDYHELKEKEINIGIYNCIGAGVKNTRIVNERTELNCEDLLPGIYIYTLYTKKQILFSGKLIIQ